MQGSSSSPGPGRSRRRGSLFGGGCGVAFLLAAAPGSGNDSSHAMSSADTLEARLEAPDSVRVGEPVPVTIRVTNRAGRRLTLHLQGRAIVFDLAVTREDGTVLWRRLAGAAVQSILRLEELAAGGELVLRDTWPQQDQSGRRLRPGTYYLQGSIPAESGSLTTPRRRLKIL